MTETEECCGGLSEGKENGRSTPHARLALTKEEERTCQNETEKRITFFIFEYKGGGIEEA